MPRFELVGGSEGEPERGAGLPFFHAGVKSVKFTEKNQLGCRILPAFDMSLWDRESYTEREGFRTSYIPYRRVDRVDQQTGYPVFSSWYYVVQGYQWVGNDGRGFLSPLTGAKTICRKFDPWFDCYLTAKNSDNPHWKALTEKGKTLAEGFSADLDAPRSYGVMNVFVAVKDGDPLGNYIGVITKAGMDHLKGLLDILRPAIVKEIISPAWPDFLYGDVTDPIEGLWGKLTKTHFNKQNAKMSTACFHFSQQDEVLRGHESYPIDPITEWGASVLAGRYNIADFNKVTKVTSAEEILDWMVADEFLPYALIEKACQDTWAVPAQSKHAEYSQPSYDPVPGGDDEPGQLPAPAPAPAAPAPAPSGPPTAAKPVYRPPQRPAGAPVAASPSAPPAPPAPPSGGRGAPPAPPSGGRGAPPAPPSGGRGAPPAPPSSRAGASGAPGQRPGPAAPRAAASPGAPPPVSAPRTAPAPTAPPLAPAPVAPPAPVAEVAQEAPAPDEGVRNVGPLDAAEYADWKEIENRYMVDPNSINGPETQRMMALGDRAAVNNQA